jgi:hypothetical protein
MRRAIRTAAVTIGLLLGLASAAGARCPTRSSIQVVRVTPHAIVYERKGGYGATYACWLRNGRPHRINRPSEFGGFTSIDTLRFAGHFVAFQEDFESAAGFAQYWIVVRNLLDGSVLWEGQISERGGDYGDRSEILLVKRNGSVAWLVESGDEDDEDVFYREVHIADRDHRGRLRERMLDQYHRIRRNSLRMTADRRHVTWLHGTELRRATFR